MMRARGMRSVMAALLGLSAGCSGASHGAPGGDSGLPSAPPQRDSGAAHDARGVHPSRDAASDRGGDSHETPAPDSGGGATRDTGTTSMSDSGTRDPAYWPFSAASPWNMPLANSATYESSADAETVNLQSGHNAYVNSQSYSFPVYIAAPSDPTKTIDFESGYINGAFSSNGSVTLNIPTDAAGSQGTDSSMVLITPDHSTGYESWQFAASGAGYSASFTVEEDLSGTGWGVGVHAAGCSVLGGLIRANDLTSLRIPHTLAVAIGQQQAKSPQVWPATAEDSGGQSSYTGTVPMGALLAIPPSVNVATLATTPEGKALGQALQDYGAYVVDTAGSDAAVGFVAEPAASSAAVTNLSTDITALAGALVVVTNNTASTPGGGAPGAPRRAPMAPPLN